jgi:threonine/homoserine efflux transporter RhtA
MSEATPETQKYPATSSKAKRPRKVRDPADENPTWYKILMFGSMLIGLAWILVFYISSARYPLGSATDINIGNWNILVGFAIAMVGFIMTTRWK